MMNFYKFLTLLKEQGPGEPPGGPPPGLGAGGPPLGAGGPPPGLGAGGPPPGGLGGPPPGMGGPPGGLGGGPPPGGPGGAPQPPQKLATFDAWTAINKALNNSTGKPQKDMVKSPHNKKSELLMQ